MICVQESASIRRSLSHKSCAKLPKFRSMFSIACALFHFPYPPSPLLATLTKTAGCIPTIPNLELATLQSPLAWRPHKGLPALAVLLASHEVPHLQLSRSGFIYPLFFLHLAHSLAQWTLHNSFVFKRLRTLSIATGV